MTPLKRHPSLQPLSRDHHFGLLLCWKIRTGMQNGVEEDRIRSYCQAYFEGGLEPHFKNEEEKLFPLLGTDHHLVHRAILEHRRIRKYVYDVSLGEKGLSRLEELLDKHIRFEEREVFPAIQEKIGERIMNALHFPDDDHAREMAWPDTFWEKTEEAG